MQLLENKNRELNVFGDKSVDYIWLDDLSYCENLLYDLNFFELKESIFSVFSYRCFMRNVWLSEALFADKLRIFLSWLI